MHHTRRILPMSTFLTAVCAALIAHDFCTRHSQIDLIASIQKGDLVAVKRALAWGADPNGVTGPTTAEIAGAGQTATTFAVWAGSSQIVEALINAGGFVNVADPDGRTPLVSAIYARNVIMCNTLLKLGADPCLPGADPFHKTVIETPMEAVDYADQALKSTVCATISTSTSISNPKSKSEVQAMYLLLRRRGAIPTVTLAMNVGDNDEDKTLIAGETHLSRKARPHAPTLYTDARPVKMSKSYFQ